MPVLQPFPRVFTPPRRTYPYATLPFTRDGVRRMDPFFFEERPGPLLQRIDIWARTQEPGSSPATRAIVGLLPSEDFRYRLVKPHESTLTARLARQEATVTADGGALAKPVLLTVPSLQSFWATQSLPEVDVRYAGESHGYTLSALPPRSLDLAPFGPLVIADGHHRAETHARLYDHVPVAIVGADELTIETFLTIVDTGHTDTAALLRQLSAYFSVHPLSGPALPAAAGSWTCAHNGQHFGLTPTDGLGHKLPVRYFTEAALNRCFGIHDVRHDPRLIYTETAPPAGALAATQAVFRSFPLRREAFFAEAAAGRVLPPKSTRFLPRVPSGLVVWIPG